MTIAERIHQLQTKLCMDPDSYSNYDAIIAEVETEVENEEYRLIAQRSYKNGTSRKYLEFTDGSLLSIHRKPNGNRWSVTFHQVKTLPSWA